MISIHRFFHSEIMVRHYKHKKGTKKTATEAAVIAGTFIIVGLSYDWHKKKNSLYSKLCGSSACSHGGYSRGLLFEKILESAKWVCLHNARWCHVRGTRCGFKIKYSTFTECTWESFTRMLYIPDAYFNLIFNFFSVFSFF